MVRTLQIHLGLPSPDNTTVMIIAASAEHGQLLDTGVMKTPGAFRSNDVIMNVVQCLVCYQ